jgi:hypothetical protein
VGSQLVAGVTEEIEASLLATQAAGRGPGGICFEGLLQRYALKLARELPVCSVGVTESSTSVPVAAPRNDITFWTCPIVRPTG